MADFSIINKETVEVHAGQRGYREQIFLVAFPTTAATATLPLNDISQIDNVQATWAGAPATDEQLYHGDTMPTDGPLKRPATGKLTIGRTGASPTSALKAWIRVRGR